MEVKLINGPMAGESMSLADNIEKVSFPSFPQGEPILSSEAERRLIDAGYNLGPYMGEVRQITYRIHQINNEWIGETEELKPETLLGLPIKYIDEPIIKEGDIVFGREIIIPDMSEEPEEG